MINSLWRLLVMAILMWVFFALLFALFNWMVGWSWWLIILIGLGGAGSAIGFGQIAVAFSTAKLKGKIDRVLTFLLLLYYVWFSISSTWGMDTAGDDTKILVVKILATAIYAGTYVPLAVGAIMSKD